MAGMWMRNRPHGPTRVSAKSAANGKLEAEQRIWPDPCLDPNLFVCYKVILHGNRILSFAGACMFFCDDTQIRPVTRAPITVLFG
jgi:hypothetical protein